MFCQNCGAEIPDGQYTCYVCGAFVGSGQPVQNQYQQQGYQQNQYQQQQGYQQNFGQQNFGQQGQYQQNYNQQMQYQQPQTYRVNQNQQELGMKWFKFIIYAQLFLNAFFNFFGGIGYMNGVQYNQDYSYGADLVYAYYDGLKGLDMFLGISCILLAVFAIVVRFFLAGYKSYGPMCYFVFLGLNIVIPVIYLFLAANELNTSVGDVISTSNVSNIATSIIMIGVNVTYFKNRKHLFTN